jgi:hypothetical protein
MFSICLLLGVLLRGDVPKCFEAVVLGVLYAGCEASELIKGLFPRFSLKHFKSVFRV